MRTIIEVQEELVHELDEIAHIRNQSRAALIREAIRLYLERESASSGNLAFGIWKARQKEGVAYQNTLRDEWSNNS